MNAFRHLTLVASAVGWCAVAQASSPVLAPGPVDRCLQQDGDGPVYPFDLFKHGQVGRVLVDITFTAADKAPDVTVLGNDGDRAFVKAVREHVSSYRVPCLSSADGPVRVRREFNFVRDRRAVRWADAPDPAVARRQRALACMKHERGETAEYSVGARRAGEQGRVLAELRFTTPNGEPTVKMHAPEGLQTLASEAADWLRGQRMPCLQEGPVDVVITMIYRLEDMPAYGFRPMAFKTYLAGITGIADQRVQFDTTTMGCPFDVRLQYRQPFLPNAVGELGDHDPMRAPLLRWLAAQSLRLNPSQHRAVFADSITLTVPCIRLNLNAKE